MYTNVCVLTPQVIGHMPGSGVINNVTVPSFTFEMVLIDLILTLGWSLAKEHDKIFHVYFITKCPLILNC